jgi:hypothetical protein
LLCVNGWPQILMQTLESVNVFNYASVDIFYKGKLWATWGHVGSTRIVVIKKTEHNVTCTW